MLKGGTITDGSNNMMRVGGTQRSLDDALYIAYDPNGTLLRWFLFLRYKKPAPCGQCG